MTISRRTFLVGSAAAAGILASGFLGKAAGAVSSKAFAASTKESLDEMYEISPDIKRYDERNNMFARAEWDPVVKTWPAHQKEVVAGRIAAQDPGFQPIDRAFSAVGGAVNPSGTGAGTRGGMMYLPNGWYTDTPRAAKVPPKPVEIEPDKAARVVKKVAKFLGASLVGIAAMDERWIYNSYYLRGGTGVAGPSVIGSFEKPGLQPDGTLGIPSDMKYVVALAIAQDIDVIRTGPVPIAGATTGRGYQDMALVTYSLAEFLWGLGYKALPCGNDTGLSVPFAAAAGLGELGRAGILVTPEYGTNVRLAKVITNLPMTLDKPKDYGIRKFCNVCKKCAKLCPGQCIPEGEMTTETACMSNLPGTKKWVVNVEKCYKFWNDNGQSCGTCQATCPFTKDSSLWTHAVGAKLAPYAGRLFVAIDDAMGYGLTDPASFWDKE